MIMKDESSRSLSHLLCKLMIGYLCILFSIDRLQKSANKKSKMKTTARIRGGRKGKHPDLCVNCECDMLYSNREFRRGR